jgi:hypothetical protein
MGVRLLRVADVGDQGSRHFLDEDVEEAASSR